MKRRKVLITVAIIFISIVVSGCAEAVPLEEYDAKVSEYESTIYELENKHIVELFGKDAELYALKSDINTLSSGASLSRPRSATPTFPTRCSHPAKA